MYLLFDIGGTKMRLAVSKDGNEIQDIRLFKTPRTFEEGLSVFQGYLNLLGEVDIEGVSGSLPGTFDREMTQLLVSLNLTGWIKKPIKQELEKIFRSTVLLSNDAQMAGLGEAVYGSGKGFKIVVYLTISTGVGGTRFVDGKIDENLVGTEPGYQIIDMDGSVDKDYLIADKKYVSNLGYLQRLISGEDLSKKYGKPLEMLTDNVIWEDITRYLSVGMNNTIVHWNPDVVVLGGGVAMSDFLKVEDIKRYLKQHLIAYATPPEIKKALLGDNSGLYGALEYIKQKKAVDLQI